MLNFKNVLQKSLKVKEAISATGAFLYFVFAIFVAILLSQSGLTYYGTREIMLFLGFNFAREVAFVQIAHVTHTTYEPLNTPNFILLSLFIGNISLHGWGISLIGEYDFLVLLIVFSFLSYAHLVYYLTLEITTELKIPVFKMPYRRHQSV